MPIHNGQISNIKEGVFMNSYICCGMQYGDEGKGSFIDWLVHYTGAECVVKYNGGSQASHTVETPDGIIHKFSQLGSGMFREGCHTYITKDMVVNPDNMVREMEIFCEKTHESFEELADRVHIHKDCLVVTPYHKLINRMRELSLGENRRGSVGTGVSEVQPLAELKSARFPNGIKLTMGNVYCRYHAEVTGPFMALYLYARDFYEKWQDEIWKNCPDELTHEMHEMVDALIGDYNSFINVAARFNERHAFAPQQKSLKKCLYDTYENTLRRHDIAVWEGSQGLLIDREHGIAPNTTMLVTTNTPALDLAYLRDDIKKIGVTKAFCSRHGMGVFPTEDARLSGYIKDNNQDVCYFNGEPRYGWFDAVLFNYANRFNEIDGMVLSSLDKLSGLDKVKICHGYNYGGPIDDEFDDLFLYYRDGNNITEVTIYAIKQNSPRLKHYLKQCSPLYAEYNGWGSLEFLKGKDMCTKAELIREACGKFLKGIHMYTRINIAAVSAGPTREDKIVLDSSFFKK